MCYPPQPSASADNTNLGLDNSRYHAQPHPIIAYYHRKNFIIIVQTLLSSYKLYYHRTNFTIIVQTLLSSYKLYHRTNFIFPVQSLLSSYKLYYHRTNFIIVQTLFSPYKLYYHLTNFIIIVQTLLSSYKLYHRTNFIFPVQTLLSSYKLCYQRCFLAKGDDKKIKGKSLKSRPKRALFFSLKKSLYKKRKVSPFFLSLPFYLPCIAVLSLFSTR